MALVQRVAEHHRSLGGAEEHLRRRLGAAECDDRTGVAFPHDAGQAFELVAIGRKVRGIESRRDELPDPILQRQLRPRLGHPALGVAIERGLPGRNRQARHREGQSNEARRDPCHLVPVNGICGLS